MSTLLNKYFSLIKKFVPEPVVKPYLGLDIGTHSCKLVKLIPQENTFSIQHYAIERTLNGRLTDTLKNIIASAGDIQGCSISTGVSGQGTLIRYIEMPRMSLEDLKNSFYIEADRYFPFPKDQIYTDCFILDNKLRSNKMRVLVAAAKKELIDKRIELLQTLGVQTHFIGINTIALANLFHVLRVDNKIDTALEEDENSAVAILDFGETTSNLLILKDGLPRFTRDIFTGGKDLVNRVKNVLGISLFSNKWKQLSQDEEKVKEILNACDSILSSLVSEIRLSFDYFLTENDLPISKVYLTGGMASFPQIYHFLEKNLELPVNPLNVLKGFKIEEHLLKKNLERDQTQLGVALGLALYQE